jgi:hypothetical protein
MAASGNKCTRRQRTAINRPVTATKARILRRAQSCHADGQNQASMFNLCRHRRYSERLPIPRNITERIGKRTPVSEQRRGVLISNTLRSTRCAGILSASQPADDDLLCSQHPLVKLSGVIRSLSAASTWPAAGYTRYAADRITNFFSAAAIFSDCAHGNGFICLSTVNSTHVG